MAMNFVEADLQVAALKQQSAVAAHVARLLSLYKKELMHAWAGVEVDWLCKAIDIQVRACEKISDDSDVLSRDMTQAIQEILSEEAAAGSADTSA